MKIFSFLCVPRSSHSFDHFFRFLNIDHLLFFSIGWSYKCFFFLNCVLFCFTVAAPATQTKSSGKPEINQQEFTQLQQQLQDMKEQVICNFLLRLSANHIDEYNFDQARDLTHVTFPALGTGCESISPRSAILLVSSIGLKVLIQTVKSLRRRLFSFVFACCLFCHSFRC